MSYLYNQKKVAEDIRGLVAEATQTEEKTLILNDVLFKLLAEHSVSKKFIIEYTTIACESCGVTII